MVAEPSNRGDSDDNDTGGDDDIGAGNARTAIRSGDAPFKVHLPSAAEH